MEQLSHYRGQWARSSDLQWIKETFSHWVPGQVVPTGHAWQAISTGCPEAKLLVDESHCQELWVWSMQRAVHAPLDVRTSAYHSDGSDIWNYSNSWIHWCAGRKERVNYTNENNGYCWAPGAANSGNEAFSEHDDIWVLVQEQDCCSALECHRLKQGMSCAQEISLRLSSRCSQPIIRHWRQPLKTSDSNREKRYWGSLTSTARDGLKRSLGAR